MVRKPILQQTHDAFRGYTGAPKDAIAQPLITRLVSSEPFQFESRFQWAPIEKTSYTTEKMVVGNKAGTPSPQSLTGHEPVIMGTEGSEVITGTDQADIIYGAGGDDWIKASGGSDYIHGGHGSHAGELGMDIVDYSDADRYVKVDLGAGYAPQDTGYNDHDVLAGIEGVSGSNYDDLLKGNDGNNRFYGNGGDDIIMAGGGSDVIIDGAGTDWMLGGAGNDTYYFVSNDGNDVINGEAGYDTLDYSALAQGGVNVNLHFNVAQYTGSQDQVFNCEGVLGSNFNDLIVGNASKNHLNGNEGADRLYGLEGNDVLFGGYDDDVDMLAGGGGNDKIVWLSGDTAFGGEKADDSDFDLLILEGPVTHFDSDDAGRISGIEAISLKHPQSEMADAATTLTLSFLDVLNITSDDGDLLISGAGNDTLILQDIDGAGGHSWVHTVDSTGHSVYSWSGNPDVQIFVDGHIQVQANVMV